MVPVISITQHTYVEDNRIDKLAYTDEPSDECRYEHQEEDADDHLRLTPYCINTQEHQNCT